MRQRAREGGVGRKDLNAARQKRKLQVSARRRPPTALEPRSPDLAREGTLKKPGLGRFAAAEAHVAAAPEGKWCGKSPRKPLSGRQALGVPPSSAAKGRRQRWFSYSFPPAFSGTRVSPRTPVPLSLSTFEALHFSCAGLGLASEAGLP